MKIFSLKSFEGNFTVSQHLVLLLRKSDDIFIPHPLSICDLFFSPWKLLASRFIPGVLKFTMMFLNTSAIYCARHSFGMPILI